MKYTQDNWNHIMVRSSMARRPWCPWNDTTSLPQWSLRRHFLTPMVPEKATFPHPQWSLRRQQHILTPVVPETANFLTFSGTWEGISSSLMVPEKVTFPCPQWSLRRQHFLTPSGPWDGNISLPPVVPEKATFPYPHWSLKRQPTRAQKCHSVWSYKIKML